MNTSTFQAGFLSFLALAFVLACAVIDFGREGRAHTRDSRARAVGAGRVQARAAIGGSAVAYARRAR